MRVDQYSLSHSKDIEKLAGAIGKKGVKLYSAAVFSAMSKEDAKCLAGEDMHSLISSMKEDVAQIYLKKLLKHERYDYSNTAFKVLTEVNTVKSVLEDVNNASKFLVSEKQKKALTNVFFDSMIARYKQKEKEEVKEPSS